jgi:hypothetical protein
MAAHRRLRAECVALFDGREDPFVLGLHDEDAIEMTRGRVRARLGDCGMQIGAEEN